MSAQQGGYFSAPATTLDPDLFDDSGQLHPDVRSYLTRTLYTWFRAQGYNVDNSDLHIWLAGSGVSYQWGNGDLDTFFALDPARFATDNPWWAGFHPHDIAAGLNAELHETLWPAQAGVQLGDSVYDITYYCLFGNQ